ncbi:hypothetical protein ACPXB3_22435, partial [Gordonia sp. DT219]
MRPIEDILRDLGVEFASIIANSSGYLFDGPWDTFVMIQHYSSGQVSGTRAAFVGGEQIVDRPTNIKMMDMLKIHDHVELFRRDFPVPLWLFDALVLVVDREPVRGVVHVVCGDVAAGFEASMATAGQVQDRAAAMFLG